MNVMIGILLGGAVGAWVGWKGRCVSGACPLTSNPYTGGAYGALIGVLLSTLASCSSSGTVHSWTERSEKDVTVSNVSAAIVKLSEEGAFDEVVLRSPVPVVVDFWAPWCGPCRAQSPILEQLAGEHGDSLRVVKINVDELPGLAGRFGVQAIPTLIVFENGRKKSHLVGLQSLEDLQHVTGV